MNEFTQLRKLLETNFLDIILTDFPIMHYLRVKILQDRKGWNMKKLAPGPYPLGARWGMER